jgi:pilus assembly protein Flp/PilA
MIKHFFHDETGSTAIEYTLIASLISIAMITGVSLWSDSVTNMFDVLENAFNLG